MIRQKINIALDLGTSSVGWSVITDNYKILKTGVVLFEDPTNPKDGSSKAAERRTFRQARRQLNRKKVRLADFKKLITKELQWFDENTFNIIIKRYSPRLNLIKKGLEEPLNKEEIVQIIYTSFKHRGFNYQIDDEKSSNQVYESNTFPSLQKLAYFNKNGSVRNSELVAQIPRKDYANELKVILTNSKLDNDTIEKILNLFNRQRSFAVGPGSIKSPTSWGLYQKDKNGNIVKVANTIFDKTIGKCEVYKDEQRGLKNAPITEIFNLFNDLNNLKINDECLSKLHKEAIIKDLNSLKPITFNYLLKMFKDKNITGYRIDSNNKPLITPLKNTKTIINFLLENNLINKKEINFLDNNFLNKINDIFLVFVRNIEPNLYRTKLKELLKIDLEDSLINVFKNKLIGLSTTSSLSFKAMMEFINSFLDSSLNSSAFFYDKIQENKKSLNHFKFLDEDILQNSYLAPTIKKGVNLTFKVLNILLKKYRNDYEINIVSIELPRENNTYKEKQFIKQQQNNNAKILKEIAKELKLNDISNLSSKTKLKLKLWYTQNKKDPYSLQEINGLDVINNPNVYQIDHIIPFSISGDDSINNKVLTSSLNNQNKAQRTPFQTFKDKPFYNEFKENVLNNKLFNNTKKEKLLYEKDPKKEQLEFINRQLSDTRAISKTVLNVLTNFFNNNKNYPNVKVRNIKGNLTNYARYNFFDLPKNRDDYVHHAIDSLIINYFGSLPKLHEELEKQYLYDKITRQYKKQNKDEKMFSFNELYAFSNNARTFEQEINKVLEEKQISFYREIQYKINGAIADETIYSIKLKDEENVVVYNRLDLINSSKEELDYYFGKNAKKSLNICDKKLWTKLNALYLKNEALMKNDEKLKKMNPFLYDTERQEIVNKKYVVIDKIKVSKIKKIFAENKNIDMVYLNKKQDDKSGKLSLKPFNFRIYKNDEGKLVTIPLNIKCAKYNYNLKRVVIDEEKLNDILKKNGINNKKYFTVVNGMTFRLRNKDETFKDDYLFYSNGGGTLNENIMELKCLTRNNSSNRIKLSVLQVAKNFIIVRKNILGEIKKEIDLMKYFNL